MIKFFVPAPVTEHKLRLARRLYGPDETPRGAVVRVRFVGVKPDIDGLKRRMRFAGFWKYDEAATVAGEFGSGPVPGVWIAIWEAKRLHEN